MLHRSSPVSSRWRGPARALPALGLLLLLGGSPPGALGQRRGSAASGVCRMGPAVPESPRTLDGREFYIEPSSLTVSGGELLLAGTPNYVYHLEREDDPVDVDELFGAILRPGGSALRVPPPLDGDRISGVRTAPRRGGGWHVVFAEAEPGPDALPPELADRLWYGVLQDTTWAALERLPLPDSLRVRPFGISSLLARGDSLAVAAIVESPGGRHVILFSRVSSGWTANLLRRQHPAYVEPVWTAGDGLRMVIVQADETLRSDTNSLLLYSVGASWTRQRRMAGGNETPVDAPVFLSAGGGYLVGGIGAEGVLMGPVEATAWPLDESLGPVTIDAPVLNMDATVLPPERLIVVVEHSGGEGVPNELRFYSASSQGAALLGAMRNPFQGFFAVAFRPPGEVIVSGPVIRSIPGGKLATTQLLRAEIHCDRG